MATSSSVRSSASTGNAKKTAETNNSPLFVFIGFTCISAYFEEDRQLLYSRPRVVDIDMDEAPNWAEASLCWAKLYGVGFSLAPTCLKGSAKANNLRPVRVWLGVGSFSPFWPVMRLESVTNSL